MKETNSTEQLFDGLFRETLNNAPSAVPPAAWEGISASLGHSAAAAGVGSAAVQSALWFKAVVAATVIGAAATGVWYFTGDQPETTDNALTAPVQTELREAGNTENQSVQTYITKDKPAVEGDNNSRSGKTHSGAPEPEPLTVQSPYGNPVEFTYGKTGTFQFRMPEMETAEAPDKTLPAEPSVKNNHSEGDYTEDNAEQDYERTGEPVAPPSIVDSSYILVPDVFTPDGDGINDTYQIVLIGEERYELIIYAPKDNSILYRSKNKYQTWNARMPNGEPAPSGTYLAKVIYKFKNKKEESKWVKITLIR